MENARPLNAAPKRWGSSKRAPEEGTSAQDTAGVTGEGTRRVVGADTRGGSGGFAPALGVGGGAGGGEGVRTREMELQAFDNNLGVPIHVPWCPY